MAQNNDIPVMSNLDPALNGSGQQRSETGASSVDAVYDRLGQQYASSSSTKGNPSYSSSSQQNPYYHYQATLPPSNPTDESARGSNAQTTPESHTFLPSSIHQTFSESEDAQAALDDAKRQRACEACRGLKVRCDQDPLQPDVPCKRCAKAGRPCVITQPNRKRQKKADSRVAELEKKLDALTAVLNNRQPVGSLDPFPQTAAPPEHTYAHPEPQLRESHAPAWNVSNTSSGAATSSASAPSSAPEPPAKKRRTEDRSSEWDTRFAQIQMVHKEPEAKSYLHPDYFAKRIASLVTPAQGAELFRRYMDEMTVELPLVVFPKGTSPEQVFHDKPVLYLAVISAASFSTLPTAVCMALQDESLAAIADLCVRRGVKSLELIQAMQVVSQFYKPPGKAEHTNFYQVIHMAAVMAMDIGLGKRFPSRRQFNAIGGRPEVAFSIKQLTGQNSDLIEARRAWLACYYLGTTASMVLRRPNLVRWTQYMNECIEVLETSPEAAPTDRLLCQHLKIQHICEDIGLQFSMDDSTVQININDPKTTYCLNVLENQLKAWKQQLPSDLSQHSSLIFFEHATSLYLHEIALHFNHNIEDFRLPFTEESLKNVDSTPDALSPQKIAAIEACLKAAQGILTTMLTYKVQQILAMPLVIFFVRCVYALIILIKMHVAITLPDSELGKIIQPDSLNIEYYIHGLYKLFRQMGTRRDLTPEKPLRIMSVLSEWFIHHKESLTKQQGQQVPDNAQYSGGVQASTGTRYDQTPLQMLSQVASGQQQQDKSGVADWNVDASNATRYQQKPGASTMDDGKLSMHQAQASLGSAGAYDPSIMSMLDMLSGQDYGWGSGFEQAMDMTLGQIVGDLQGGGLDNSWYMGDNNAAPHASNAGPNAGAQPPWSGV